MKKLLTLIAFVLVAFMAHAQSTQKGDVNGDGDVSVNDVAMIVNYILGITDSNFIIANADINGDGEIDINDVMGTVSTILGGDQDVPILQLSTNIVFLKINEAFPYEQPWLLTQRVDIISGSGSYTITNSDPNVANATLSDNFIVIEAINEGISVIEVTDTQNGRTETITVIVDLIPVSVWPIYIHLYVGQEKTVDFDFGWKYLTGHIYTKVTGSGNYSLNFYRNQDAAEVEIKDNNTLKLTGKKEGIMIFELTDNEIKDENDEPISIWYVVHIELGNLFCPDDNHPHKINLGLPSGTQWACCNVGANKPEGYGGYYAWGETWEKSVYYDVTYQYSSGLDKDADGWYDDYHEDTYTEGVWQYLGDNIAGTKYDVAHVKWGKKWQMPSIYQMGEVWENCTETWISINGLECDEFIGPSGGRIYFPAAGARLNYELVRDTLSGNYWLSTQDPAYTRWADNLSLFYDLTNWLDYYQDRCVGRSVRPVWVP